MIEFSRGSKLSSMINMWCRNECCSNIMVSFFFGLGIFEDLKLYIVTLQLHSLLDTVSVRSMDSGVNYLNTTTYVVGKSVFFMFRKCFPGNLNLLVHYFNKGDSR